MDAANFSILTKGLLTVGTIGGVSLLILGLTGRGPGFMSSFTSMLGLGKQNSEHQAQTEQKVQKIESVEQEQVKVEVKILDSEKVIAKNEEEIRNIVDRASKEIQEHLKENDIKKVNNRVNDQWNQLSGQSQ